MKTSEASSAHSIVQLSCKYRIERLEVYRRSLFGPMGGTAQNPRGGAGTIHGCLKGGPGRLKAPKAFCATDWTLSRDGLEKFGKGLNHQPPTNPDGCQRLYSPTVDFYLLNCLIPGVFLLKREPWARKKTNLNLYYNIVHVFCRILNGSLDKCLQNSGNMNLFNWLPL